MYTYRWGVPRVPHSGRYNHSKVGRGSDSGMEEASMKMEPEVAVDPKGTTANLSRSQPSLEA